MKENVITMATHTGIVFFSIPFLSSSVVALFSFRSALLTLLTKMNFLVGL